MKNAGAGAPSVVATLWSVNDVASEKLMVDFYKKLQKILRDD
ncbi:CHAT domain-containing protein [Sphingobacterium corticibacterium]|uniref:CHAT domain-containing protein n=1 Tax=Sphingobacterium corticibacterium TaxID=2484746 RepID=A0A4Q6XNY2_9SPHI|nr:CHAT domain-containing protein [Sphingobacterium corticibacterium]RZF58127.1 CHAT domain-containing protein [Sphingobacterium corticibacterium]